MFTGLAGYYNKTLDKTMSLGYCFASFLCLKF